MKKKGPPGPAGTGKPAGGQGKHSAGQGKTTAKGFASKGAARGRRAGAPAAGNAPERRAHPAAAPASRITPNRRAGFAAGARPYDYAVYESEPATPAYMSRLFAKHAFPVTPRQQEQFWLHYSLLREHNARLDLTRIMGLEATVLKHFIDSAIILNWFRPAGPVLDIGSGPGFPGIPLAVMRPDVAFILAESRGKRVGFLEEVVRALALTNVTVFPKSVREDSPLGADYGLPVTDAVSRALEAMAPTLERLRPILSPGGSVAFLKGPGCDDELAEASACFPGLYKVETDVKYTLPATDLARRLVVFRKSRSGEET